MRSHGKLERESPKRTISTSGGLDSYSQFCNGFFSFSYLFEFKVNVLCSMVYMKKEVRVSTWELLKVWLLLNQVANDYCYWKYACILFLFRINHIEFEL